MKQATHLGERPSALAALQHRAGDGADCGAPLRNGIHDDGLGAVACEGKTSREGRDE